MTYKVAFPAYKYHWYERNTEIKRLTRGKPRPARAQLTFVSKSLSLSATGDTTLDAGNIGPDRK